MKKYDLFGYEVEIDEKATKDWYTNSEGWDCPCEDCKYFVSLAKQRKLPAIMLETLSQFEIAPEKATYVCSIYEENNEILYEICYRIAGNITKERMLDNENSKRKDFYCGHNSYPYGAPGFPETHFDLEFWIYIPKLIYDKEK